MHGCTQYCFLVVCGKGLRVPYFDRNMLHVSLFNSTTCLWNECN